MIVFLKPIGDLRDYFGRGQIPVEIPNTGCVLDLLDVIHNRWGNTLPSYLWDAEQKRLRGPVYLVADGRILDDINTPLKSWQQITLMKALAGG